MAAATSRPAFGTGGRACCVVGRLCHSRAVEFADALVADELWGWPVAVLDHLRELRRQAWGGEISLEEWRERDAASRAGLPGLDLDQIKQFQDRWIEEWVRTITGDRDEDSSDQLMRRLTALLDPAPTDEQLWDELAEACRALADPKHERRLEEAYRRKRARIAEWLTRPGSGIDRVTGLPWVQVMRYRIVDDPGVGPVPQYVELSRNRAEDNAAVEDRQRAEMVRETADWRRLAVPMAKLHAHQMTWLPRLLCDAAEDDADLQPLLADLRRIWTNPAVQRLLLDETARGWPVEMNPEP